MLCEITDELVFACWHMKRDGDTESVPVWGLAEHFVTAVGKVSVKSGDRVADTVAKLQCSEWAARKAWEILDPGKPS